jgi:hypothetical protein
MKRHRNVVPLPTAVTVASYLFSTRLREDLMIGRLVLTLCCVAGLSHTLFGSTIGFIDGLPDSFIPGQPVAFDVRLPSIVNLGAYNIDVVVESSTGAPGTDFYFDVTGTVPAASKYIFPSTANYFDAANVELPGRHRITLSDFEFAGITVLPGTNDRVATVVLRTLPSFSDSLQVYVDAQSLILDTPDVTPTPVDGFESLKSDLESANPAVLSAVPEAPTFALTIVSILGAPLLKLFRRSRFVHQSEFATETSTML